MLFLTSSLIGTGRPSIYADIDFCKNPGAICSDKRSEELRWVTGMFHWSTYVQKHKSRDYSYLGSLQTFVDEGNFTSTAFIDVVNGVLGGSYNDTVMRSEKFFDALRAFGLIEDYTSDATALSYCGTSVTDAGLKCALKCVSDIDCPGNELCQPGVIVCDGVEGVSNVESGSNSSLGGTNAVVEIGLSDNADEASMTGDTSPNAGSVSAESDNAVEMSSFSSFVMPETYYCGENWASASSSCLVSCPGGNDAECPTDQKCFADVTACSGTGTEDADRLENDRVTNYCGKTWDEASMFCFARTQCPGGHDEECAEGERCFGEIQC